jgi:uroporphyrinogen decarboxylase
MCSSFSFNPCVQYNGELLLEGIEMEKMSHRQRLQAALAGQETDRVPVAFWRHWPGDDQRAQSLVDVALEYQHHFDLDFIKLPVSPAYTVADYGVKTEYRGSLIGDRDFTGYVIKKIGDWDRVTPLDVHQGSYGRHLEAVRHIVKRKAPDVPLIVTIFNPLSVAAYMAGDEICLSHLRAHNERVVPALQAIAETTARFVRAALAEGADGIFLSTRFASSELMPEREYLRFAREGDLVVLQAAQSGWLNILHLHGPHPQLAQLSGYPVQIINWHDRTTEFDLGAAAGLFPGLLMGGIEQYHTLRFGTPEQVVAQAHDAIRVMQGRRLVLAPGCTYNLDVPQSNLLALRRSVDSALE